MGQRTGRSNVVRPAVVSAIILLLIVTGVPNPAPLSFARAPQIGAPFHLGTIPPSAAVVTCRAPVICPGPRAAPASHHSLVSPFISARGWTDITASLSSNPSARTQPAIAYDPAISAVVLFGGYDQSVAADGDTWEFSNSTWTHIAFVNVTSPPARWGARMVWDAADRYLLLFGGRNVNTFLNDTWSFNGTAWSKVNATYAPSPRSQFPMAYDAKDGYVMIEGGLYRDVSGGGNFVSRNDTWSYLKGNWSNLTKAGAGPSYSRAESDGAYDSWDASVLAVGGLSPNSIGSISNCYPDAPIANYTNNKWHAFPSNAGPLNLSQEMVTYDPQGPFLLVFGGYWGGTSVTCQQVNNTWVRIDGKWVNISSSFSVAPSIRYLGGIAYDAADQEVVLFGGNSNSAYLSDTWTFVPPVVSVNVNASKLGGAIPLTVRFASNYSGAYGPVAYNWSFGDGNFSSAGPNVSHTFHSAGRYTISVNVTDPYGRNGSSKFVVTAVVPPQAAILASPTTGSVPLVVGFQGVTSGGQAPISYSWQFGDGVSGTGRFVNHTYAAAGSFVANLTVTDHFGDVNRTATTINVAPALRVSATATPVDAIAPVTIAFTSVPAGGNAPYTFLWNFGDGGQSTVANPNHLYNVVGFYNATVEVTDVYGRTSNATVPLELFAPLAASATINLTQGIAPLAVTLTASASGGRLPYTFSWEFGDGSPIFNGTLAQHTYVRPANYVINLTAYDADHRQTVAHATVSVVAPLSVLAASSVLADESPATIAFSSSVLGGIGPFAYRWAFGDLGPTSALANPSHLYARPGTFAVTLVVTDSFGEVARAALTVTLLSPVTVALDLSRASLFVGQVGNLSISIQGGKGPYFVQWSGLPPGCSTQNTTLLSCAPSVPGTFNVSVRVTDSFSRQATANGTVVVQHTTQSTATGGLGVPVWELAAILVAGIAAAIVGVGVFRYLQRRAPPRETDSSEPEVPQQVDAEAAPQETFEPES